MARYDSLVGKLTEVDYRAGELRLTAAGTLVADSGKSIFIEEQFSQRGRVKTLRLAIPYQCIVRIREGAAPSISALL